MARLDHSLAKAPWLPVTATTRSPASSRLRQSNFPGVSGWDEHSERPHIAAGASAAWAASGWADHLWAARPNHGGSGARAGPVDINGTVARHEACHRTCP